MVRSCSFLPWHAFATYPCMRKKILLIVLFIATGFDFTANAQLGIQVNIVSQPLWGPVGYDYVNYYYMPDIDAYYDVPNRHYVYFEDGRWITRNSLPPRYSYYDINNGYKVVINDRSPWMHNDRYRTQYASYKGRHDQGMIRNSHDDKYRANPGHPEHNQWKGGGHDRGHGDNRGHEDQGHQGNGGGHQDQGHQGNGGGHQDQGHQGNGGGHQDQGHGGNGGGHQEQGHGGGHDQGHGEHGGH